ncbi:hypothetical protein MHYP_G00313690 [Metynnis hypsauchen]
MPAEEKRQRVERPSCSRAKKRRLVYVNLLKAAVRRYTALWEAKKRRNHRRSPRVCGGQPGLPSGAMAPRNTTQYLMELVYADLSERGEFDFSNPSGDSRTPTAEIAEQPNPETLCSYCVDVSLPTQSESPVQAWSDHVANR